MLENIKETFIYLVEQHFILFLLLCMLQGIHYLLIKKYDKDNVRNFITIRKNEWIVIFISFLLVYLINVSNSLMDINLSITMIFSWSIVIIFIVKEMNNILLFIKEKGAYVPNILFKTLNTLEDEIEGEDDEDNN